MGITFNSKLVLILWVASCAVLCPAQDKATSGQSRPDLSGTWVRNSSKSKNIGPASVTVTISHKEPEIKITRKVVLKGKETITDGVYFTDGRGEKNMSRFGGAIVLGLPSQPSSTNQGRSQSVEARSKTKWDGNKLVSRSEVNLEILGDRVVFDVTEKRELSSDGKTLTVITIFGRSTDTEVFDRVQ